MATWILFAIALLVILMVVMRSRERFQPEFLDKRQVRRTMETENSSYSQETNHVNPRSFSMGPIAGIETPFRVNQYTSYVV